MKRRFFFQKALAVLGFVPALTLAKQSTIYGGAKIDKLIANLWGTPFNGQMPWRRKTAEEYLEDARIAIAQLGISGEASARLSQSYRAMNILADAKLAAAHGWDWEKAGVQPPEGTYRR